MNTPKNPKRAIQKAGKKIRKIMACVLAVSVNHEIHPHVKQLGWET